MSTNTLNDRGLAASAGEKFKDGIEATRASIDRTMEALGEKLHPRETVERLGEWVRNTSVEEALDSVKQAPAQAADHVRRHPLPYALAGAGLAWIAFDLVRSRDRRPSSVVETGKERAEEGIDKAASAAGKLADDVAESASKTGEKISDCCKDAADAGREALGSARERLAEGAGTAGSLTRENPLAVGGGLLALGLIAGLLLPRSRTEARFIEDRAQNLVGKARAAGRDALQRGKDAIADAVDRGTERARAAGLMPEG